MAVLVPATPLKAARPCPIIGVAGTSPAMTADGHLTRTIAENGTPPSLPTLMAFVVKVPSARFAAKRRKMEQKNRAPLRAAPVILGRPGNNARATERRYSPWNS
jgi:hypothetical protein